MLPLPEAVRTASRIKATGAAYSWEPSTEETFALRKMSLAAYAHRLPWPVLLIAASI